MNHTATDIERVVREVLAELSVAPGEHQGLGTSVPSASENRGPGTSVPSCSKDGSAPPTQGSDTLRVDSRVVTMQELSGRLDGVRRVAVLRKAVVTPAVQDELLRRGIALTHADRADGRPAPLRLVLLTMGTDFDPAALAAGLTREGTNVEHSASDCLIAATDQLAAELARPDTLGVLLTRHTAAGLCLANRLNGVRAATGVDAPAVATATAAIGANLLVADPQAGTFFQLKQIVTEFCRGGVRPCPTVFRARLA